MEEVKAPLAQVIYKCNVCGADHTKLLELYFWSPLRHHTKYCYVCRAMTNHNKILPSDDNVRHYRRPNGLPESED